MDTLYYNTRACTTSSLDIHLVFSQTASYNLNVRVNMNFPFTVEIYLRGWHSLLSESISKGELGHLWVKICNGLMSLLHHIVLFYINFTQQLYKVFAKF